MGEGPQPREIATRLEDRFRFLTGGKRTALPRHQTLNALVDWSYDTLSEQERSVLTRLSIFAGGCALEAPERIGAGNGIAESEVLHCLARQAAPHLDDDGQDQAAWLRRLEQERDNLRAALRWSLDAGANTALRLANALWRFWLTRGYLSEGHAWLEAVLALDPSEQIGRTRRCANRCRPARQCARRLWAGR